MNATRIAAFAREYDDGLRRLLGTVRAMIERLSGAPEEVPGREALDGLIGIRDQLERSLDEVASRRSRILVLGGLNAGKSTLINALAATQLTKVSSLPTYPCVVSMSHAPRWGIKLERQDGRAEEFTDPSATRILIQRAHAELAEKVREVRAAGDTFDADRHLPEAIRGIEVLLPAPTLARAAITLVECPPLRSPLSNGYGEMVREHVDTSAVAVFVARSQDLFADESFEGIEELLDAFEQLFVVVNLDTRRLDVGADGDLVPALEQEDPVRLIEVFEHLTTSATFKEAAEEGRLRLFPLDLQAAASQRMRAGGDAEPMAGARSGDEGSSLFAEFAAELVQELDRDERLAAFLHQETRRARELVQELGRLCHMPSLDGLPQRLERVRGERFAASSRVESARLLREYSPREWEWEEAFVGLRQKLEARGIEEARRLTEETLADLDSLLEDWFASDDSFNDLLDERLAPRLVNCRSELTHSLHRRLLSEISSPEAFDALSERVRRALDETELDIAELADSSARRIDVSAARASLPRTLPVEDLPVRRGLADVLMLRGAASIRRRILGPDESPTEKLSPQTKSARLRRDARSRMRAGIEERLTSFARSHADAESARLCAALVQNLSEELAVELSRKSFDASPEAFAQRISLLEEVWERTQELERAHIEATRALETLAEVHGRGSEVLLQAVRPEPQPEGSTDPPDDLPHGKSLPSSA